MTTSENGSDKQSVNSFRITGLPPDFYYIPDFLSTEEESSILQKIPAQRWTHLSHRRLQAHPSTLTKNNTLLASSLPAYLTNPVIERFKEFGVFNETPHQQPNHVLINEYRPGEGIMPHEDGAAYAPVVATISLGGALCLKITSKPNANTESSTLVPTDSEIDRNEQVHSAAAQYKIPTRIFQEPRSLLITTGDAYRDLLHGIEPLEVDEELNAETVANWTLLSNPEVIEQNSGRSARSTRISLTYRDVLRVSSAANKVFGGFGRR